MIDVLVDDDVAASEVVLAEEVDIRRAICVSCQHIAAEKGWLALDVEPEVCVRFASDAEVCALNDTWRNKPQVTDVLSFPMQEGVVDWDESLGDMILAMPFVQQEAMRLGCDAQAHQLHLLVHSTLHLLGYDHIDDAEAVQMQTLECQIMQTLGLHHPYPDIPQ